MKTIVIHTNKIIGVNIKMKKYLCYIENNFAYFTSDFDKQWGDDWNDRPYEHNAGEPYDSENQIEIVAFKVDLYTPAEIAGLNSNYSVEDINNKETPWLTGKVYSQESVLYGSTTKIFAGTTMENFIETIREIGGKVFIEK